MLLLCSTEKNMLIDLSTKSFSLLGDIDESPAVLIAKKLPIPSSAFQDLASSDHLVDRQLTGHNDVFTWLTAQTTFPASKNVRDLKVSLIHPATEMQISKYREQARYMVRETADVYRKVVAPWIQSLPAAKNQWVYNILEGKTEQEHILFRDDDPKLGFILMPDL